MTASVPGVAAYVAEAKRDRLERYPAYRCIECTLMRCHGAGETCEECVAHRQAELFAKAP